MRSAVKEHWFYPRLKRGVSSHGPDKRFGGSTTASRRRLTLGPCRLFFGSGRRLLFLGEGFELCGKGFLSVVVAEIGGDRFSLRLRPVDLSLKEVGDRDFGEVLGFWLRRRSPVARDDEALLSATRLLYCRGFNTWRCAER
ncbi:hypothetical protein Rs2_40289 [Raphanus sativus]|nr:hypothetical protein Rs2_40289 [Raphanus sativus]